MPVRPFRYASLASLAALATAGCARQDRPVPVAEAPAAVPPRPALPAGYAAVKPPPRDAAGRYRTINSDLDPQATIWHVRAALNVAAIGCRGTEGAGLVPAYNAMLSSKKAVLARAQRSVQAALQAGIGKDWQAADDAAMTRLYNYFAMPAAKPAFCAAAAALAPEAVAAAPAAFEAFAAAALPKLEAPFVDVYRAVDDYPVELAQWEARYGSAAKTAVAATAPAASPKLAYGDVGQLLAWTPRRGEAYASR